MDETQLHKYEKNEEIGQPMERNKGFGRGVCTGVLCTLGVLSVIFVGGLFFLRSRLIGGVDVDDVKMDYIISLIHSCFYEDVDDAALTEGAYKGILAALDDPYSTYYTQDEYEKFQIDTSGNYAGIGALLTKDLSTDVVSVVSVYEGSPAERAGLQAGDVIVSADGVKAESKDLDAFVSGIRGEEGSVVTLVYERNGEQKTVDITRAQVDVPSVTYKMLDGGIAYIEIGEFSQNTKDQFDTAVADLTAQGMRAMIIDLRYNGGGLVDSVTEILDEILPEGTTVYMEDKRGKRTTYRSDGEHFMAMPIAVLTSQHTASAAEIFAGAIRDFDYGTLIGTRTYGKGIVQTTYPLSDGSAVKLTMATYYTPSGECIHKKGIEPDIELEPVYGGEADAPYDEMQDNQIQKAIEVLQNQM